MSADGAGSDREERHLRASGVQLETTIGDTSRDGSRPCLLPPLTRKGKAEMVSAELSTREVDGVAPNSQEGLK
jgi:hypothetical protein